MWIINLPEGAGSCSCYNPPILLFLEKELPQNRKKPAFELNQKQVSFVEGTVEIDILDGRNRCRRTAKRPFWAAARVRRTSVLAVGQNLGAGVAPPPRALKSRRVEPPCGGGTHKKGHLLCRDVLFCGLPLQFGYFSHPSVKGSLQRGSAESQSIRSSVHKRLRNLGIDSFCSSPQGALDLESRYLGFKIYKLHL